MKKKNVSKDTLLESKTIDEISGAFERLNAALHTFSSAVSADTKLSLSEIVANEHLRLDGPLTPKELSKRVQMGSGATTAMIDRLERRGFVERIRHPEDRRSVLVRQLEQPELVIRRPLALQEIIAARTAALDEEERRTVLAFLTYVADDVMKAVEEKA